MTTSGIGDFLRQIDLQGPSFPFDSVASLVATSLDIARADFRLYSSHFEDKALTWLARFNLMEGTRGKSRMEAHTVHELAALIAAASDLSAPPERQPSVLDWLPDCAIVEHVIQEQKTAGIRQFILDGVVPSNTTAKSPSRSSNSGAIDGSMQPTLSPLATAFPSTAAHDSTDESAIPNSSQNRVSAWLKLQLKQEIAALEEERTASGSRPADRVRKALDLALLGVYYLGMLRKANIRSDSGLADMVRGMLEGIRPELNASMRSPTGQYQIWSGLSPLLPSYRRREEDWPVLLRHGESSGTRPDLLPVYKNEDEAKGEAENVWLGELWTLPEVSSRHRSQKKQKTQRRETDG
jgi:ataxia telangiectasia mutated family protein